jgi:hypothetical protein
MGFRRVSAAQSLSESDPSDLRSINAGHFEVLGNTLVQSTRNDASGEMGRAFRIDQKQLKERTA